MLACQQRRLGEAAKLARRLRVIENAIGQQPRANRIGRSLGGVVDRRGQRVEGVVGHVGHRPEQLDEVVEVDIDDPPPMAQIDVDTVAGSPRTQASWSCCMVAHRP